MTLISYGSGVVRVLSAQYAGAPPVLSCPLPPSSSAECLPHRLALGVRQWSAAGAPMLRQPLALPPPEEVSGNGTVCKPHVGLSCFYSSPSEFCGARRLQTPCSTTCSGGGVGLKAAMAQASRQRFTAAPRQSKSARAGHLQALHSTKLEGEGMSSRTLWAAATPSVLCAQGRGAPCTLQTTPLSYSNTAL